MIDYKIKQFIDNSLEDADERISVTSRARYEEQSLEGCSEWMDIIVNFYVSDPQAFISLQPTSINLTNDLFPLYIDEAKIENALEMQNKLLSKAKAEVEEIVKSSTISVNEIKYISLNKETIVRQLRDKLTKVVSYYDNGFLTFAIVVPFDYADMEIKDFNVFEDWARKKLNLSNDYRLLTGDIVESIEEDEIEHIGGLPWYRVSKPSKTNPQTSQTESEYDKQKREEIKNILDTINSFKDFYITREEINLPWRDTAERYGLGKEYEKAKEKLDRFEEYQVIAGDTEFYIYYDPNKKTPIFIDKELFRSDRDIGRFIGKQGRNIKELSQSLGRKIILR